MELGEKLKQARLDAGLSQRALAGSIITRNMLSQIENGSAKPSMKTLGYLAGKLGKPVSFFLDEDAFLSPNHSLMVSARRLWDTGNPAQAALVLEGYQSPDPVFDREKDLLWVLVHLDLAETALQEGREPYALTLLEKSDIPTVYCSQELTRRRLLLLGKCKGQHVTSHLPSLDSELLLRATEALSEGNPDRSGALLDAAEDHSPQWYMLRGQVHFARQDYSAAAACFHHAEDTLPQVWAMLEACYKELGDFKQAYAYACRQR